MPRDVRIYGNQHGSWVEFSGDLARRVDAARRVSNETLEEFLDSALFHYIKNHHPDYKRWIA